MGGSSREFNGNRNPIRAIFDGSMNSMIFAQDRDATASMSVVGLSMTQMRPLDESKFNTRPLSNSCARQKFVSEKGIAETPFNGIQTVGNNL